MIESNTVIRSWENLIEDIKKIFLFYSDLCSLEMIDKFELFTDGPWTWKQIRVKILW